ncbi:Hpt domain-containing protein [uncultured Cohaesibacter sp.]|uniref:Hpt domain-containing protein n=1 Tax=uncultured Cohaesibacter sp. TaxID=1002546 RepID=UPI00292EFE9B|nr:Hpt domain-containing protein [uncultured Cohaesibacter sp.]
MADYEIVKPKVDLRKKIKILPNSSGMDPVAKAEEAMERLSINFGNWMRDEVAKLQYAWDMVEKKDMTEESLDKLFRSAHDIKGQAHTMGFPLAGHIAGSLCELIERIPNRENLPKDLLCKHVQAISAVVKENAREEDNVIGKELVAELGNLSEEIISKFEPQEDTTENTDKK